MHINFIGRYQEIAAHLSRAEGTSTVASKDQAFSRTLADVRQEDGEKEKTFNVLQLSTEKGPELARGPMARLRLSPPELTELAPTRVEVQLPEVALSADELVATQASVKTPTLLSARRIERQYDTSQELPLRQAQPGLSPATSGASTGVRNSPPAEITALIKEVGMRHGIDPALSVAVASAESSFDPNAVSSDGHESKGLFQLLDSTGKHWLEKAGLEQEYQPFDVKQNAELGIRYLRYLHDLFSKESALGQTITTRPAANSSSLENLAVAAYNAGEGRVASAQERAARAGLDPQNYSEIEGYLPESTREYVRKVTQLRGRYEELFIGKA
jgi:soluble lytic murein transglycosylase-like protein